MKGRWMKNFEMSRIKYKTLWVEFQGIKRKNWEKSINLNVILHIITISRDRYEDLNN